MQTIVEFWNNLSDFNKNVAKSAAFVGWSFIVFVFGVLFDAYKDSREQWIRAHGDAVILWLQSEWRWILVILTFLIATAFFWAKASNLKRTFEAWTPERAIRVTPVIGYVPTANESGNLQITLTVTNISPKRFLVEKLRFRSGAIDKSPLPVQIRIESVMPERFNLTPNAENDYIFTLHLKIPNGVHGSFVLHLHGGEIEVYENGQAPAQTVPLQTPLSVSIFVPSPKEDSIPNA